MKGARQLALAAVVVAALVLAPPVFGFAQKPPQHNDSKPKDRHPPAQQHTENQRSQGLPGFRQPGIHGGDWLRQHQSMPLEEQQRALHSDPNFQRLPPERQQHLEQRLQKFNSLPPQQRERVLNRMETFEHLPPSEQQRIRGMYGQMRELPDDRRQEVQQAARRLRSMPPEARERVLNSPEFRSRFSDQEQGLVRGLSTLNGPSDENGPSAPPR
ncbi:MAG: DUF3106 domain-containing protein [Acidobacteria bacterium]|nr:DUF3106 domain-containing protein [Acidobacteriota bacterium]